MSFEDTPNQVAPTEVATPVKKRGRPAGAKNKQLVAKKAKGRPVSNPLRLNADLEVANLQVALLKDALDDSRERHKTEVDGLMAIISYLENTLKEAWKDAASV
jgi:hypothetical protein